MSRDLCPRFFPITISPEPMIDIFKAFSNMASISRRYDAPKNIYHSENGQHPPPPPSSYIETTHPTSRRLLCLLCRQLYRRTGAVQCSAVYCRQSEERLGEASQCKTTRGCCPCSEGYYIFFAPPPVFLLSGRNNKTKIKISLKLLIWQ